MLTLATDNNAAECVKVLLNNGFYTDEKDENGENALCRAIRKGNKYEVSSLLLVVFMLYLGIYKYDLLLVPNCRLQSPIIKYSST